MLNQQLSSQANKYSLTAATTEINRLKQAAVTREAEYSNTILDRDQARDTAADLRRQLDCEKKSHEVTRQETQLAYSLLTKAYELYRSTGEDTTKDQ